MNKEMRYLTIVSGARSTRRLAIPCVVVVGAVLLAIFVFLGARRLGLPDSLGEDNRFFCEGHIYALRFVNSDRTFVSSSVDPNRIWFWDAQTTKRSPLPGAGRAIDVSQDGKWLVSGDYSGEVTLVELPSGIVARKWRLPEGSALGVAVSGDGRIIFVAQGPAWDGKSKVGRPLNAYHFWSLNATSDVIGEPSAEFDAPVRAIDSSIDGRVIGLRTSDASLWVWSGERKQFILRPGDAKSLGSTILESGIIGGVKVAANGDYVLCGFRLWDVITGKERNLHDAIEQEADPELLGHALKCCDLSDDGRWAAFGFSNGHSCVVDVAITQAVWSQKVSLSGGEVLAIVFSPNGRFMLTGCRPGRGAFTPLDPGRGVIRRTDRCIRLWKLP